MLAFEALRAVDERDAYANLVLPPLLRKAREKGDFDGRDAALATELVYGTLRRQGTYDAIISACVDRPLREVDPPALWLLLGLTAGVTAALHKDTLTDRVLMVGAVAAASLPVYFTSVLLIYGLIRVTGLLPYPQYVPFGDDPLSWASNMLLPWLALAILYAAMYARQSRGSMIESMAEPYIRTARAKGLPRRTVVVKHGLRAGMTPILTIFGMDLGGLLAGAVITESIFGLPGVGRLFYGALSTGDQPVILGVTLLAATFIVVANLAVDLLYAVVDPRVRY